MTIYQIDAALERCIRISDTEAVDTESGEVLDIEALEALEMAREAKIEGVAKWIKNDEAEAKAIKEEIKKLQARAKSLENNATRKREFLSGVLQGQKFSTPCVKIYFTPSSSVEVDDVDILPDDFVRMKKEANRTAIKKYLSEGGVLTGCRVLEKKNLQLR